MGKDDEVLPDSQDEAGLDALDLIGRDSSPISMSEQPPLANASTPSLRTSSSFVLPLPVPANCTATSTISQYTTDTINALPEQPSVISAFTTSSSVKTSSKPRPKPKPNYAGVETDNPTGGGHSVQNTSIDAPSAGRSAQDLSLPESTFTADISERIKARRAKKDMKMDVKVHSSVKKSALAFDAVIEISSDDNMPSGPFNLIPSPKRPRKQTGKPRPTSTLSADGFAHESSLLRQEISPAISQKRDRDTLSSNHSNTLPSSADMGNTQNRLETRDGQDPVLQPKRKKKRKVIDGSTEEPAKGSKKRPKEKQQRLKKGPANSQGKETENDQFKSSEFILDSDDEIALGNHDGANEGAITVAATVPVATSIVSSTTTKSPLSSSEVRSESLREPLLPHDHEPGARQSMEKRPKKVGKQKRKSRVEAQDELSTVDIEGRPPSKKARRNEDTPDSRISKEKPTVTSPIRPCNQDMSSPFDQRNNKPDITNDGPKLKKTKGGRNVLEDDEEQENTDPLSKPQSIVTPARVTKAPQKLDSEAKSYHPHPPKNRPLSAILQRVNGSSPRLRVSPSISRSLLTRIVPLHPNRRTPPPPPPPRIIPKKTKKEIEREEKWEEELQETVEGWCELEEAERERMRRAKRDWELGLCEE